MAIAQIRVVFDTGHVLEREKCADVLEVLSSCDCNYEVDDLSAGYEEPTSVDEVEFDQDLFSYKSVKAN